jgi:hypothetical protein
MTADEIDRLSRDQLLDAMRQAGLAPTLSLFATIHHRSDERPDGYSDDDLDEISDDLEHADLLRWRRELAQHYANKG